MLLPKISIRGALLGMVAISILLAIAVAAINGNKLAISLTVSLLCLLLTFIMFALFHWFCVVVSAFGVFRNTQTESPFAESRQPPQLLRPDDPD